MRPYTVFYNNEVIGEYDDAHEAVTSLPVQRTEPIYVLINHGTRLRWIQVTDHGSKDLYRSAVPKELLAWQLLL